MSRYVVTGCAGFIGSHLLERLLTDGHSVVGIDSFENYYPRAMKESNLETARREPGLTFMDSSILELATSDSGHLRDSALVGLLRGSDCVYHLAAQAGVRTSWGRAFADYTRLNVLSTQLLLEATVLAEVPKFVYASSSSVYGDQDEMPLHERMLPRPSSPYGVTKLAAEHLCGLYHAGHGLDTTSVRLFSVYGPRQRPDMAIQRFMKALADGDEIEIFGDGLQTRDFTFVADVIQGLVLAPAAPGGTVANIGSGSNISLSEAIGAIGKVAGVEPRVRLKPTEIGDARSTWADINRARALIGYRPATSLTTGLTQQWEWNRDRVNAD